MKGLDKQSNILGNARQIVLRVSQQVDSDQPVLLFNIKETP